MIINESGLMNEEEAIDIINTKVEAISQLFDGVELAVAISALEFACMAVMKQILEDDNCTLDYILDRHHEHLRWLLMDGKDELQ